MMNDLLFRQKEIKDQMDNQTDQDPEHRLTWTAYHPLSVHHQYLEYVAEEHPTLCQTLSIGSSSEGRDLKVIKCGTGSREIWIDGGRCDQGDADF